jgi:hypothetical protein
MGPGKSPARNSLFGPEAVLEQPDVLLQERFMFSG